MFLIHLFLVPPKSDPCHPSPCGPNTICDSIGGNALCRCLPGLKGVPTDPSGCHPECILSSDCPGDLACINNKCANPCAQNVCGVKANCRVINHSPLCTCPSTLVGNPLEECYEEKGNPLSRDMKTFIISLANCVGC